jgi:beta-phosphoglucomutase
MVSRNGFVFLFDMDGVVVNSTPLHTEAWRRYLSARGLTIPDLEDRMLGKHNSEIVREFLHDEELTDEQVAEHGARKEALYREMMEPVLEQHLVPGLREFLRTYEAVPKGLASNAETANVEFVLQKASLEPYFRAVVSGQQVARPKPHPDIYLTVAERLSAPPNRCIVFEDSHTGVEAATRAGMRVVGLTTTLSKLDGVDLEIADFQDNRLEPWLESLPLAA